MRRIRFAAIARTDIEQIFDYIAADSIKAAAKMIDLIEEACRELVDASERYPVFARRPRGELRRRPLDSYNIYYVVGPDFVEIVRVLHGARDQDEALGN